SEPEFLPAASTYSTGISRRPQYEERLALGGGLLAGFPQIEHPRNRSKTHFLGCGPEERVEFAELGRRQVDNGITPSPVRRLRLRFGLRSGRLFRQRLVHEEARAGERQGGGQHKHSGFPFGHEHGFNTPWENKRRLTVPFVGVTIR